MAKKVKRRVVKKTTRKLPVTGDEGELPQPTQDPLLAESEPEAVEPTVADIMDPNEVPELTLVAGTEPVTTAHTDLQYEEEPALEVPELELLGVAVTKAEEPEERQPTEEEAIRRHLQIIYDNPDISVVEFREQSGTGLSAAYVLVNYEYRGLVSSQRRRRATRFSLTVLGQRMRKAA